MLYGIPTGIRCDCILSIRDEGDLIRNHFQDEVHEGRDRIPFNIEFRGNQRPYLSDIRISDMSFIRSRMDGNPFGAELLTHNGCMCHIRHIPASCVPYCGNLVDVYT